MKTPRPRKLRFVQGCSIVDAFFPSRMPPWGKEEVILPIEGLEAIKLNDFQGLDQETAARMMNVRPLGESWLRQGPFGGNTSNREW
jgi:predicted DNA-binding protein (UPF0251 family)